MDSNKQFLIRTADMPDDSVEWQKDRSGCRWMRRVVRKGCIHEQCIGGAPDLLPRHPGPVWLPIVNGGGSLPLGLCMYCDKPVLFGDQAERHFSHVACEEVEREFSEVMEAEKTEPCMGDFMRRIHELGITDPSQIEKADDQ